MESVVVGLDLSTVVTAIATELETDIPLVAAAGAVIAGAILALRFGIRLLRSFAR